MSVQWPSRPDPARRAQAASLRRRLPVRQRVDLVLVLGWAGTALAVFLIGWFLFVFGVRQGWFDEPIVAAVEDARINGNLRVGSFRMLDASVHHDGQLYVSQKPDLVHRYHPRARTWSTERLSLPGHLDREIDLLRSGNGDPNDSGLPLWGLTRSGGLIARAGSAWQAVTGDRAWLAGGRAVAQTNLTASALSADRRFEAYGSASQGLGIFDRQHKNWILKPKLGAAGVDHVRWWKGYFWVASNQGLARILPLKNDQDEDHLEVKIKGRILDLDVSESHGLFAVSRTLAGATRITRWSDAEAQGEVLFDEGDVDADLAMRNLAFAFQQDDKLWLAGDAGLRSYDTALHRWRTHLSKPVHLAAFAPEAGVLHAAHGKGVLSVRADGQSVLTELSGDRVVSLSAQQDGRAAALTRANRLWQVSAYEEATEWFPNRNTTLRPGAAHNVVVDGKMILFGTAGGLVIHDTVTRSYTDYSKVPDWIRNPGYRWVKSGTRLFAVRQQGGQLNVHSMYIGDMERGIFSAIWNSGPIASAPIRRVTGMDNARIACLLEDDRAIEFGKDTYRWINMAGKYMDLDASAWIDVTENSEAVYFASSKRVDIYDMGSREWAASLKHPGIREVGTAWGQLAVMGRDGSFSLLQPNKLFNHHCRGRFPFDDAGLSDVRFDSSLDVLVLAGDGHIGSYDLASRNLEFSAIGKGPVEIAAVPADHLSLTDPVVVCDGALWLGASRFTGHDGQVERAFLYRDRIWSVARQPDGSRRLVSTELNGRDRREAFAKIDSGLRLQDVRGAAEVPGKIRDVVVLDPQGVVHRYDHQQRSWSETGRRAEEVFSMSGNLYLLDSLDDAGKKQLRRFPGGDLDKQPASREQVLDVLPDATRNQILALGADGAIYSLDSLGNATGILDAPGKSPQGEIVQVWPRSDTDLAFLCSTRSGELWRYDRAWNRITLRGASTAIDVCNDNGVTDWVTLQDESPEGLLFRSGRLVENQINGLYQNAVVRSSAIPSAGIDHAVQVGRQWVFVERDGRVRIFHPGQRRWRRVNAIPDAGRGLKIGAHGGRLLAWMPGAETIYISKSSLVDEDTDLDFAPMPLKPDEVIAVTDQGRIWKRTAAGGLLQSGLPDYDSTLAFSTVQPSGVSALEHDGNGRLTTRGKDARLIHFSDSILFTTAKRPEAPLLEVGWLNWESATRTFDIATTEGRMSIPADDFFDRGRLLPERVLALSMQSANRTVAASAQGLFIHQQRDLRLDDPRLVWQRMTLDAPVFRAGDLHQGERAWSFDGRAFVSSTPLTEHLFGNQIQVQLHGPARFLRVTADGEAHEALSKAGFDWDVRRELQYINGRSWVKTEAGWHAVDSLSNLSVAPPVQAGTTRQAWVDNGTWRWMPERGGVSIKLKWNGKELRDGPLVFDQCRLVDAIAVNGRLVLLTQEGVEVVPDMAALGLSHPDPPLAGATALELDRSMAGTQCFLKRGEQYFVLDDQGQFTPGKPPSASRLLYEDRRLRFSRRADGQIKKEIRLRSPDGNAVDLTYLFLDRRFPFDVIDGVREDGDHVYLATAAGLEVHPRDSSLKAISEALTCWHLSYNNTPSPVKNLSAAEKMSHIEASSDGQRWTVGGDRLVTANGAAALPLAAADLRIRNRFWEWRREGGQLVGRYRAGLKRSEPIELSRYGPRNRRCVFPHDRIRDVSSIDNQTLYLWGDGWMTSLPSGGYSLHRQGQNFDLTDLEPNGFLIAQTPERPKNYGRRLVYLETGAGTLLRWRNGGWVEPSDKEAAAAQDAGLRPVLYQDDRLRLRAAGPTETPQFELRQGDAWAPLAWDTSGVLEVDQWYGIETASNGLWAASRAGLIYLNSPWEYLETTSLSGDLIPLPQASESLEMRTREDQLQLRFDRSSDRVWQRPADPDAEVEFESLEVDPFADAILIGRGDQDAVWTWERRGRRDGEPGRLVASWREQALPLVNGRFPFDAVNSIAFFRSGLIEMATDQGGWFETDASGFKLEQIRRPTVPGIVPESIRSVLLTGPDELGLERSTTALRWNSEGEVRETTGLPEWQHDDGFWSARREKGQLTISTDVGGSVDRQMDQGRFLDQVARDLPVSLTRDRHLLATAAGMFELDSSLLPVAYVGDATNRLHVLGDDEQAWSLIGTNLTRLDGSVRRAVNLPIGEGVSLARDPSGLLRLRTSRDGVRGAHLLGLAEELRFDHVIPLDASERSVGRGDNEYIGVRLAPGEVSFVLPGTERSLSLPIAEGAIRQSQLARNSLFVLLKDELLRIDLVQVRRRLLRD